tara:strand:- start:636 stop:755 length:120 start_codon:yes stop_codon:yes gene_type:complete
MVMTFDIYMPSKPKGAGVILTNSAGWSSPIHKFPILEDG